MPGNDYSPSQPAPCDYCPTPCNSPCQIWDAGKGWIVKGDARKMGMGREKAQTQHVGVGKTNNSWKWLLQN